MTNRILAVVINDFPHIGGAEQVILNVCRHIVTDPRYKTVTLRVITSGPGAFDTAVSRITGTHADYVDLRSLKSNWFKPAARRHIIESVRIIIEKHRQTSDEPVIILCNSLWSAVVVNGLAGKIEIPVICAVHADIAPKRMFKRALFDLTGRFIVRNISGWITVSDSLSKQLQTIGVPDNRIRVIPNGVDLPALFQVDKNGQWRAGFNIPSNAVVILTAGRLAPDKGQHVVLESVKALLSEGLNIYLLITGTEDAGHSSSQTAELTESESAVSGAYTRILQKMIQAESLQKRIILTGFVDDIHTVLNESDIVVSASRQESFGLSVLEAMAFARPVVVSDIGGHKRLVTDGVNGFRIDPDDITGFTTALRRLIKNADLRGAMGHAGRRIAENYDNNVTMNQWMEFIFEHVAIRYPEFSADERQCQE